MTQINVGEVLVTVVILTVFICSYVLIRPLVRKEVGKADTKKVQKAQENLRLTEIRRRQIMESAKVDELEHLRMMATQARLDDANFKVSQLDPAKDAQAELVSAVTTCVCGHPQKDHQGGKRDCAYPCACPRYVSQSQL